MVEDFKNLGLPPIHNFNLEIKPFNVPYYGYSLYVDGEFMGSFCSPFTLYYELVSKVLPDKLYLNK